jgi:biotin carboxylase
MASEPTESVNINIDSSKVVTTQHQPVVVDANPPTTEPQHATDGTSNTTPLSHPHGKVLFAIDGDQIEMGSVRHYAKQYGFETLCLIESDNIMDDYYKFYKNYDYCCVVNNFNSGDVINNLVKQNTLGLCPLPQGGDAVICFTEWSLPAAYGISERYNIYPASKNENFKPLNKLEQRQCLSRNNLEDQQPKYRELNINSDESIQEAMQQIGLPAVLKGLEGVNAADIYIAKTQNKFEEAVRSARSLIANNSPLSGLDQAKPGVSSIFVLEEYIPHERGKEYSLEGSVLEGKVTIYGISEKILKDLDGSIQSNGHLNVPLNSPEAQTLSSSTTGWIDAFGYRNGLFNLDCMIMDGNAKLLEANYRCGGTNAVCEAAYNYSTEEAVVANAAGHEFFPNQVPTTTDRGLGYLSSRQLLNSRITTLPFPGSIEFITLKGRDGNMGHQYVLFRAKNAEDVKSNIAANLLPDFVVDTRIVPPLGNATLPLQDVLEQTTPILTTPFHPPGKVLFALDGNRIDMGSVRHYAKQYGFETLCVIDFLNKINDDSRHYDYFCAVTNFNPGDVINHLMRQSTLGLCPLPQEGDAVISFHEEWSLPAAYEISERYNIYPASKNKNFKPLNKLEQRQCLSRNNLEDQQPQYRELNINSDESIQEAMQQIGLPAVLKATGGMDSAGVYIAKTQSEFEEAVGSARSLVANKLPLGGLDSTNPDGVSSIFVLEEYIPHERGKEYSLEGSVLDGKVTIYGISEKILKNLDGRIISQGHLNVPLNSPEAQTIASSAPGWIDAFEYRNGPFNIDCMIMDGKAKLLEANYRCGGTNPVYELAYNYSAEEAVVANAAGREFYPNQVPTPDGGLGYLLWPSLLNSQETALPFPGSIKFIPAKGSDGRKGYENVLVRAVLAVV